jgi:hypothetical protein
LSFVTFLSSQFNLTYSKNASFEFHIERLRSNGQRLLFLQNRASSSSDVLLLHRHV